MHPYRTAPPRPDVSAPRALPDGMSQIQRAKLGLFDADPQVRFWLMVTGLMLAFGVVNALADVIFRVLV